MTKRSILITGCSSGIGLDAAKQLQDRGWRVFATCRQQADADRLTEMGLESFKLDAADEESCGAGVERVLSATGGTIDAIFNNGAFAQPGAVEDVPRDAMRALFEANLFGVHDLTCRVLPAMRKQGHGRIVNCSSVLGIVAAKYRGPYNASKFAMEGLTDTLRMELDGTDIHPILIQPGPIRTDIRIKSKPHFERWIKVDGSAHEEIYKTKLIPRLKEKQGKLGKFELMPEAVTAKLIHALESPKPKARYRVTTPTYIAEGMRRLLTTRRRDKYLENA